MIDSSKPIRIDPRDNVAVAIQNLPAGTVLNVDGIEIVTREPVDRGHKIALADIAEGAPIIKYGWPIAHATVSIEAGQWIHTHNAFTNLSGIIQWCFKIRDIDIIIILNPDNQCAKCSDTTVIVIQILNNGNLPVGQGMTYP